MSLKTAIDILKELNDDSCVPKNVKAKAALVIKILETGEEPSLRVSKALHELEDLADNIHIQADTRTKLYNIVSSLELQ